ncbi:hypothetical protein DKM44_14415 [Deinococcus irradiatisoli]|uniref:Tyrosine specific protein phosphatases domain-containing protein n=1 Tax=Deinococcus irradiatisoli TaxID=2202254 RepID=A0A2Z3JH02_9DEIO|nr:hypothetical protein [Deinococcus irradiatisoli]AWN24275.1 hypothetical protein DKM44_14415 [Deinococcus irradiatisoli]
MDLYIRGRDELDDLPPLDLAISINDPGDDPPELLSSVAVDVLSLAFHDAETDEAGYGFVLPQAWHLVQVKRRLLAQPPRSLLVQCTYGFSRSPAVAIYALSVLQPRWSAQQLVDNVLHIRPAAAPNGRLMRLAEEDLHKQLRRALKHAP